MDENQFLKDLLKEAVQELMVFRLFVMLLGKDNQAAGAAAESTLYDLRSDDVAIKEMRTAWDAYLEAHVSNGGMFPPTCLRNFVDEWALRDKRKEN